MSEITESIDLASANKRLSSNSPRNQASNLTYALQQAGPDSNTSSQAQTSASRQSTMDTKVSGSRSESLSVPFGGYSHTASRPISVAKKDSVGMGGSYMGGMSWGGMSMGSFLQDDIMMGGMSPGLHSPSLHSSSYLPRVEANFWNNLKCCETTFGNLHELVAHFEDVHKQAPGTFPYAMSGPGSERLPRRKSSTTNPGDWRSGGPTSNQFRTSAPGGLQGNGKPAFPDSYRKQSTINMQEMGTIGEMEMDDGMGAGQASDYFQTQNLDYSADSTPQMSHAVVSAAQGGNGFQSNTTTPPAAQTNFNNSLYSSMNQTAFGQQNAQLHAQQQQLQQQQNLSDSQRYGQMNVNGGAGMAGGEYDSAFSSSAVPFDTSVLKGLQSNFRDMSFGSQNEMGLDLCINEPAKNLYSNDGGFNLHQYPHFNFTTNPDALSNGDENAKKLQAQRLAAGVGKQPTEEERPFRCPVIGCEKAYKNANGLRYHEKHGHSTQKLKENGDGTFSIVDPSTSIPYPGTLGMEKEKPYRCDFCGKRYKNLNGLKYHRNHSPPCNPEFSKNQLPNMGSDIDGEPVY